MHRPSSGKSIPDNAETVANRWLPVFMKKQFRSRPLNERPFISI
jgi:hypothetical protein